MSLKYPEETIENHNLEERCYKLGQLFPSGIDHDTIGKVLMQIVSEENMPQDAFLIASKSFAKGFSE